MSNTKTFAELDQVKSVSDSEMVEFNLGIDKGKPLIKIAQGGWDGDWCEFSIAYMGVNAKPREDDEDMDYFGGEVLGVLYFAAFTRLCSALVFEQNEDGDWIIPESMLADIRTGRRNVENCTGAYNIGNTVIKDDH